MKIFNNQFILLITLLLFTSQLSAQSQFELSDYEFTGIVSPPIPANAFEWSGLAAGPIGLTAVSQEGYVASVSATTGEVGTAQNFSEDFDFEAITHLYSQFSGLNGYGIYAVLSEDFVTDPAVGYVIKILYITTSGAVVPLNVEYQVSNSFISSNVSLEGLTYDPINKILYVANEKNTRNLYYVPFDGSDLINFPPTGTALDFSEVDLTSIPFDPVPPPGLSDDFAGLFHLAQDPSSVGTDYQNNILLLSQHCQSVYEIQLDLNMVGTTINSIVGSFVESIDLKLEISGNPTLCNDENSFKPEGIAFSNGKLYVVCDHQPASTTYIFGKNLNNPSTLVIDAAQTTATTNITNCFATDAFTWYLLPGNQTVSYDLSTSINSGTGSNCNFNLDNLVQCTGYTLVVEIDGQTITEYFITDTYNVAPIYDTEFVNDNSIYLTFNNSPTNFIQTFEIREVLTNNVVYTSTGTELVAFGALQPCTDYYVNIYQGEFYCTQYLYPFTTTGCPPPCQYTGEIIPFYESGQWSIITWDHLVGATYEVYYSYVPGEDCSLDPTSGNCLRFDTTYPLTWFVGMCNIEMTVWVNVICPDGNNVFIGPVVLGNECRLAEFPAEVTQSITSQEVIDILEYSINGPEVLEIIVSMPNSTNEVYFDFFNQVGRNLDMVSLTELANMNETIFQLIDIIDFIEQAQINDPENEELQENLMAIQVQLIIEVMLSNEEEERPRRIATSQFEIHPNPAIDKVVIYSGSGEEILYASIYNVVGKLVSSIEVNNTNAQLDVSRLSNGIYLVEIETLLGKETKKLIIE